MSIFDLIRAFVLGYMATYLPIYRYVVIPKSGSGFLTDSVRNYLAYRIRLHNYLGFGIAIALPHPKSPNLREAVNNLTI